MSHFEDDHLYRIASVLDPRFKLNWCTGGEAAIVRKLLCSKVPAGSSQVEDDAEAPEPPTKRIKLTSFMGSQSTLSCSSTIEEIDIYLSEPVVDENIDALDYWGTRKSKFPSLYKLVASHLSPPASSAPVERLFSVAGSL